MNIKEKVHEQHDNDFRPSSPKLHVIALGAVSNNYRYIARLSNVKPSCNSVGDLNAWLCQMLQCRDFELGFDIGLSLDFSLLLSYARSIIGYFRALLILARIIFVAIDLFE